MSADTSAGFGQLIPCEALFSGPSRLSDRAAGFEHEIAGAFLTANTPALNGFEKAANERERGSLVAVLLFSEF